MWIGYNEVMIRGLGERSQTGNETGRAETGGWSTENMSQVKFAGDTMKAPVKTPEQRAAEMRAREEALAKMRADLMKMNQKVDSNFQNLNRTVTGKVEQMGGRPAVQLDTGTQQAPKKRFGLFGRR